MDSFLRLLQIALIITQIYQSQQTNLAISSSTSVPVSATFLNVSFSNFVSSTLSIAPLTSQSPSLSIRSSFHSSDNTQTTTPMPLVTTSTSMVQASTSSKGGEKSVRSTVITASPTTRQLSPSGNLSTTGESPKESTVTISVSTGPGTSTLQTSGVPVTLTGLVSHTASPGTPANSTQSTLQTSNVSVMLKESVSPTSNVSVASTEPASNGSTALESTKATSVSHSGSISHNMTANYSSSSASQPENVTVTTVVPTTTRVSSSVQSLTPSPVSLNWTDWSVNEDDCQKYCSEKGGTVTASRQCKSYSSTLANSVCSMNDNTTKVFECGKPHCPISGTEAIRSFISVVAVGILLAMLSTFV